jgi:DNA-binding SARP family transcriptional activator
MDPELHPVASALTPRLTDNMASQWGRRLRLLPVVVAWWRVPAGHGAPSVGALSAAQVALSPLHSLRSSAGAHASWALRLARRPAGWVLCLAVCAVAGAMALCWLAGQRLAGSLLSAFFASPALAAGTLAVLWPRVHVGQTEPAQCCTLHFDRLLRIMERAESEGDADQIAPSALEGICQHVRASCGFVALRDEAGVLVVRGVSQTSSLRLGDVIDLPAMPQPSLHIRARQAFNGEEVALLIPLRTPRGEHGLLGLGPSANGAYGDLDLQFLASTATQLSLAIENAQLRRCLAQTPARPPTIPLRHIRHLPSRPMLRTVPVELAVRCLGELSVHLDGRRLQVDAWGGRSSGHRHAKAVFAFLLANRTRTVGRDEVIEVVWGDSADLSVLENRLDRTVCALRRALEPGLCKGSHSTFILSQVGGYRLNPELDWRVDAEEFGRLLAQADKRTLDGDCEGALARCLDALALYRGDYLADCPFVDRSHLIYMRRDALRRQYVETLLSTAELYRALGGLEKQLHYLHRAVQEDEYNERAYQMLVAAYCEQGREAEARRICLDHRARLAAAELSCSDACFGNLPRRNFEK